MESLRRILDDPDFLSLTPLLKLNDNWAEVSFDVGESIFVVNCPSTMGKLKSF